MRGGSFRKERRVWNCADGVGQVTGSSWGRERQLHLGGVRGLVGGERGVFGEVRGLLLVERVARERVVGYRGREGGRALWGAQSAYKHKKSKL